jgi:hypothetical protein
MRVERSPMATFEIKVALLGLPAVLNVMREWLDHNKASTPHFRSSTGDADDMVVIYVGFTPDDDHSGAFRRRFG